MIRNNLELPHITNLETYVAGKPIETLAREKNLSKIIKLAGNENPYGPSPNVLGAIKNNLTSINQYPDPDQYNIKQALANFYNITTDMLAIGNGSDELFQLIMRAFVCNENNVIIPKYSFVSYQIAAQSVNAAVIQTAINNDWQNNLDDILAKINNQTKLICFANPNNPTGSYINYDMIGDFIAKVPQNILIILDEAYFEYVKFNQHYIKDYKTDHSVELLKNHTNLIITRTFSKVYGLAGLRIGYSMANPDITAIINKIKQPFNVNRLSQIAAIAALGDQDYIKKLVTINNSEREIICNYFNKLELAYIKPTANFVTINTKSLKNSEFIYDNLLNNGLIIRPLGNYEMNNYLRITIGSIEENKYLLSNLSNITSLMR